MQRICVSCGSSPGRPRPHLASARAFGRELARASLGRVYGGGKVSLMGILPEPLVNLSSFS